MDLHVEVADVLCADDAEDGEEEHGEEGGDGQGEQLEHPGGC